MSENANLGLATTLDLLGELSARIDIHIRPKKHRDCIKDNLNKLATLLLHLGHNLNYRSVDNTPRPPDFVRFVEGITAPEIGQEEHPDGTGKTVMFFPALPVRKGTPEEIEREARSMDEIIRSTFDWDIQKLKERLNNGGEFRFVDALVRGKSLMWELMLEGDHSTTIIAFPDNVMTWTRDDIINKTHDALGVPHSQFNLIQVFIFEPESSPEPL